jgi:hypothetical protein
MKLLAYGECSVFVLKDGLCRSHFCLFAYLCDLLEGMNTVSLMIWSLMLSRVKEVMYGHARTMMVMSRVIS